MTEDLVVVGASVAATAFIERMRELGFHDRIVVVDHDPDAPYDRPPVSKRYLLQGDADDIAVDWSDLDATLVRARATGVDAATGTLRLDAESEVSSELRFGRLVVATGAIPARLPMEPADTFVLRSASDARALRDHTDVDRSVIIIGAGAIGVELASSLAARGSAVTLLDRAAGPLERLLAGHLIDETTAWLEAAGVTCRWSVGIARIEHAIAGWQVELDDGEILESDLVISAVGARPAVGWLSDSGVLTDGALLVGEDGRVITTDGPLPNAYAIGDVVTRRHDDGTVSRTESWAAARQHAVQLAEDLTGADRGRSPAPYFWTEVAGRMVQVVGELAVDAPITLEAANPDRRSAFYRVGPEDAPIAWIGVNSQPRIARLQREL